MIQAFVGCTLQRARGRVCTASQVHIEDFVYGTTPGLTYGLFAKMHDWLQSLPDVDVSWQIDIATRLIAVVFFGKRRQG